MTEEQIVRNTETNTINKQSTMDNVCSDETLRFYLKETSIMDVICDKLTSIDITVNNIVTNSELSLNYEQLELLSESEPEQVLTFLINSNNFKYVLNKCVDIIILVRLMNIFSKIQLLQLNEKRAIVLDMIYNSKYLEHLNNALNNVTRLGNLIGGIKLQKFFSNCKIILEYIANSKSKLLLNEIMQFKCIESTSINVQALESSNNKLDIEKVENMTNNNIRTTNSVCYIVKRWPQYYKSLSACPETTDIISNKVILSQNLMKGSYDNVEHYIDVQFRLLREDFIAPMRDGIQYYKTVNKVNQNAKTMPNMRMYFKVKIEKKNDKNLENVYLVHFFTKEDCSFDSKKFMLDSLLVFSNNNFQSMFFATVVRMTQKVSSSSKTLLIKPLSNQILVKLNSLYIMAESETYFLPYLYSLNVLKTLNHYNFPMKSYIVYGKIKPNIPSYLTTHTKMYSINGFKFDILNDDLWPDKKFLGLDSAQSIAFKAALTEEFTVIQGPPGTGKTYIGLRIARSIIENLYETKVLESPILVVCYTNHALDQFLEGLINVTEKIIRIGGGCKSDVLKPNILRNMQRPSAQKLLKNAYVVGLTTTGASMRRSMIMNLKPPIVIVEEAAEVLESHVVTSLTEFCQHVILIGDHKQLLPRTASFKLSKQFNFEVSLFERMVKNGFPCYTLETQHRMRPEISALMLPIYPFLKDHESVKGRSNVCGVTKNVFFIHHEMHEEKAIGSNSYKNIHEVLFFMEFARYLFKQGYHQSQVTILVTYREQLLELQKIRETSFILEDFRIECVDGFQGEENDIILLSLVRSNIDNNIGFLNIQNRICVALSRARNGLYIMGNMDNLIHSSTWKDISHTLLNKQLLGNKLTLHCEVHKKWVATVSSSHDFAKVQCPKICDIKLTCGHCCPQFCHNYDLSHETIFRCKKLYIRTLSCGYKIEIECWMRFLTYKCPKYDLNTFKP